MTTIPTATSVDHVSLVEAFKLLILLGIRGANSLMVIEKGVLLMGT
jgi:hypothetical protein